ALLLEVADQVVRGVLVEALVARVLARLLGPEAGEGAHQVTDRSAHLGRATQAVALPAGEPAGHPGRRGHEHPVVGDLLDAPAAGPQGEDVADPRLVDHLLVELADPAARSLADEVDAE